MTKLETARAVLGLHTVQLTTVAKPGMISREPMPKLKPAKDGKSRLRLR